MKTINDHMNRIFRLKKPLTTIKLGLRNQKFRYNNKIKNFDPKNLNIKSAYSVTLI
jgi:hypothetical protein